ncbi:MAG TPA: pitrilysin family protein [Gammaproteobacteria bacterium]|nr:pitrilysin family protein [Gammaproteobacteria bacterium]
MTQPKSTTATAQPEVGSTSILNIQHWQTSQGTPVYFVATPQLPMVDILVLFNAGASRDGIKPGLAKLTNSLLDEGTANLTADQISQQFDNVGVIYRTTLDRDMGGIGLRSLTDPKFLEPAINTFTQVLTAPNFPEDAVQRIKNQVLISLQEERQSPDTIAKKAFVKLLYGDQPYGHSILGSEESVQTLTRADVQQFYQQYYVAKNAVIVMVGDLSTDKAREIANQVTQGLPPGQPANPLLPAKQVTIAQQKAIDFPAQQTTVLLGQVGITPQDPDYFPLTVGNFVLGSDPLVSELSKQIRSQHGWAYTVTSVFSPLQAGGPFAVFLQTRNAEAQNAINLARQIVDQFIQQGPTEQQLADAKKNIIGSFPLSLDSNSDILDQLSYMVFYHLPLDYLDTYRAKVDAVTVNQVREAYQKHLQPNNMVTVTVGGLMDSAIANSSKQGIVE